MVHGGFGLFSDPPMGVRRIFNLQTYHCKGELGEIEEKTSV